MPKSEINTPLKKQIYSHALTILPSWINLMAENSISRPVLKRAISAFKLKKIPRLLSIISGSTDQPVITFVTAI
jgi:hypothetical protein